MLFRVLGVWLLVHLIFNRLLDLDVTEININFEINIKKYSNKKIKKKKKLKMQKDVGIWHAKKYANKAGMMHEIKGQPIENQCTGKIPKYTDREQLKTPKTANRSTWIPGSIPAWIPGLIPAWIPGLSTLKYSVEYHLNLKHCTDHPSVATVLGYYGV